MPSRDHDRHYSTKTAKTHSDDLSDFDIDLPIDDGPDEVLLAGIGLPVCDKVIALADTPKTIKKSVCDKVTGPRRGSDKRDKQTLEVIQKTFRTHSSSENLPLVGNQSHYWFNPKPTYVRASNDNVTLPIWKHSSDRVKLTFANRGLVSLQGFSDAVAAVSLNLTPEVVERAQRHPDGFTDSLKNHLDRVFNRMVGEIPLYWFGVGSDDGRLHLHGAVHSARWSIGVIRAAFVEIGGEFPKGKARDHQLDIRPMTDADGWARYVYNQGPSARRLIEGKSITIPKELRREGQRLYNGLRDAAS